jgi:hypothetical protein
MGSTTLALNTASASTTTVRNRDTTTTANNSAETLKSYFDRPVFPSRYDAPKGMQDSYKIQSTANLDKLHDNWWKGDQGAKSLIMEQLSYARNLFKINPVKGLEMYIKAVATCQAYAQDILQEMGDRPLGAIQVSILAEIKQLEKTAVSELQKALGPKFKMSEDELREWLVEQDLEKKEDTIALALSAYIDAANAEKGSENSGSNTSTNTTLQNRFNRNTSSSSFSGNTQNPSPFSAFMGASSEGTGTSFAPNPGKRAAFMSFLKTSA